MPLNDEYPIVISFTVAIIVLVPAYVIFKEWYKRQ